MGDFSMEENCGNIQFKLLPPTERGFLPRTFEGIWYFAHPAPELKTLFFLLKHSFMFLEVFFTFLRHPPTLSSQRLNHLCKMYYLCKQDGKVISYIKDSSEG